MPGWATGGALRLGGEWGSVVTPAGASLCSGGCSVGWGCALLAGGGAASTEANANSPSGGTKDRAIRGSGSDARGMLRTVATFALSNDRA